MPQRDQISTIRFKNYKAFRDYSVTLKDFNVLVGPNNAGKSTILGAIRILAEGLRKARSRSCTLVAGPNGQTAGYYIDLSGLPISTENVFFNYDDSEPAVITFSMAESRQLVLFFPERGSCSLIPTSTKHIRSPADFRRSFNLTVSFVPVLGPVDHNERLYKAEAARLALLSQGASRNFRNIWYHFQEGFQEFRETIRATWPGMDIELPEIINDRDKSTLCMFCPEERFPREIYWAGFGFQVWCQMLTFILQAKDSSLLVVDEPDIYLHSDLQRQLVNILKELGPNIVLATHSTEIISEVDSDTILNINKRFRSARRIKNTRELQEVFTVPGSNLNPTLTQLAKTRRAVFVEGKDFQILARFARKLSLNNVANRAQFAVVPVGGFNPQKVKHFAEGMELTLGTKLLKLVVFDKDYRSCNEVNFLTTELNRFCWYATVHERKEIENFLLHPAVIARAVNKRLVEHGINKVVSEEEMILILNDLTESVKNDVQSHLVTARQQFERTQQPSLHPSNVSKEVMDEFDSAWKTFDERIKLVPGKETLSLLNGYLQNEFKCTLTPGFIVESFHRDEVWPEINDLLRKIDSMSKVPISES